MPKLISTALKAHIAQTVTTLATCWRIVRNDGATYGFTTHDADLFILGVPYLSVAGFSAGAIQSGTTGQVDNLQTLGYFSDTGVRVQDVKNRLFDYASVFLFMVNWRDLTMGQINMRRGWLGETVVAPNGAFAAELRGINQALVQEFGNFFSPLCRNDLGDMHCQVPILAAKWIPSWPVGTGTHMSQMTATTDETRIAVYVATNSGTTWSTEPIWNPAVGALTPDNDIVWQSIEPIRKIAYATQPVDQHNFLSTPLVAAATIGNTAQISITNDVSRGSAIEFSDGINTWSLSFYDDMKRANAVGYIATLLPTSGLNFSYTGVLGPDSYYNIQITNLNSQKGSVTKTGDILGAIVIDNFGDAYLDAGTITWDTGFNAGVTVELKTYNPTAQQVTTYLGLMMPVTAGDRFFYYPGCDKRRDTCVKKFNNIRNFRGEPDIPGIDKMLSYPDS
jgi:hypothetical protein